jgi:hypothetical protein
VEAVAEEYAQRPFLHHNGSGIGLGGMAVLRPEVGAWRIRIDIITALTRANTSGPVSLGRVAAGDERGDCRQPI